MIGPLEFPTICQHCGARGYESSESLHFPQLCTYSETRTFSCYRCPICSLAVCVADKIDGQVLEKIIRPACHDTIEYPPFWHQVAELLQRFYDPQLKYSVIQIPKLTLTCPSHKTEMVSSDDWPMTPPLNCIHCGGVRSVVGDFSDTQSE